MSTERMPGEFRPLDLAACYGTGWKSCVIRFGTASLLAPKRLRIGPSHVAILCAHEERSLWVESTSLCRHPCEVRGRLTIGVQAQRPERRIGDYCQGGGRVDLYRLSPIDRLSQRESKLLSHILLTHFVAHGAAYDVAGALISGTRLFKYSRLFPGADLHTLFCSELAAAVLMRLGRLSRTNPTRYNPAGLFRQLVREGTYRLERSYQPQGGEK